MIKFTEKPVSTLLAAHFKLSAKQCPQTQQEMARVPNANGVGCIMYLMVCTRPDIAHAVNIFRRFMSNPGEAHWEALKWILRYLKGTMDVGLRYKRGKFNSDCVVGYVDADFAGDRQKTVYLVISSQLGGILLAGESFFTTSYGTLSSTKAGMLLQKKQPRKFCG